VLVSCGTVPRSGPNGVGAQQDQIPVIQDHLKRFRQGLRAQPVGWGKHRRRSDQFDD